MNTKNMAVWRPQLVALDIDGTLHGGSNNPDAEIRVATRTGINKINISSNVKMAYFTRMREILAQEANLREPSRSSPTASKP